MGSLIFDEKSMLDNSIFKFEDRLHSQANKYTENGALLTTYYSQDENSSTVDRGLQDIDELFGKRSPVRYNRIVDFPVYGFGQTTPENSDESQVEDINVEGEVVIIPSTIIPKPMDFFTINHLRMNGLFQVISVSYDSMKVDGFYKIRYRLISTSKETIEKLESQVIGRHITDLNAIGTNINPIIKEKDYILKTKIVQMTNKMIEAYKAMFYNEKHNCFLFHDSELGVDIFDMCGNEFMAKFSLINYGGSGRVIILNDKLHDPQFPIKYNNSIYSWLELHAPLRLLRKFDYIITDTSNYLYSSFVQWQEDDIHVIQPLSTRETGIINRKYSYFDETQFQAFMNTTLEPTNEFDKLIWKYINKKDLKLEDISLYTADTLLSSISHRDIFLYTPIIIYIIREILQMQ